MRRTATLLVTLALLGPMLPAAGTSPSTGPGTHVDEHVQAQEGLVSAILSFDRAPTDQTLDQVEEKATVHTVYTIIDGAHATIPAEHVEDIAELDQVTRIDRDHPLELHLDASKPPVGVTNDLWQEGYTGAGTTIAVVDTGIDSTHPGVGDRVERGVTFTGSGGGPAESDSSTDADGHGTHVGAITGGNGAMSQSLNPDNSKYAGMAPDVGLVSLDISASFTTSTAIRAFQWVHENHEEYDISVVQNSWGRQETGQAYDPKDPAVRASNSLVADDDIAVVFSAGNSGPADSTLSMEAQNPNVISVAATDNQGKPAQFSSRGPVLHQNGTQASWTKPDLAAPGVQITSAASQQSSTTDLYTDLSGTSQAAPHVAGILAMIRAQAPDVPAPQLHTILEDTARDLGPEEGPDPVTGHGMVNTPAAIERALGIANGTLSSSTETYTANGTLVIGTRLEGLLEDEGASTERATGTFPVSQRASSLDFRFTWTSAEEDLPVPDLRVRLEDPDGRETLVPAEDQQAQRSISNPLSGTWTWTAEPASSTETGAAAYEMNTTITYEDRGTLQEAGGLEGGYFQDDWSSSLEQMFTDAREAYGTIPVLAALGTLAAIVSALLVSSVRSIAA